MIMIVTFIVTSQGTMFLKPVHSFLRIIINNFQKVYVPNQNLSTNESMIGFKGRLSFLQCVPKKPQKCGMEAWVLADSIPGYTWNWKLYAGKDSDSGKSSGLAHSVVLHLAKYLAGRGHKLFCDNLYSSPRLLLQVHTMGIGACGTARIARRGIPSNFESEKVKRI